MGGGGGMGRPPRVAPAGRQERQTSGLESVENSLSALLVFQLEPHINLKLLTVHMACAS